MLAEAITKQTMLGSETKNLNKSLHVVFGVDANFVCHMGICMTSIAINNPSLQLVFHVIVDHMTDSDLTKFKKLSIEYCVKIHIYYVNDNVFGTWPTVRTIPRATYFRLLAPELVKDAKTLLYLDADMICQGDLSPLLGMDLGENIAAAVPELTAAQLKQKNALNLTTPYFNAGFLYVNIGNWLKSQISEKVVSIFTDNSIRLSLLDQDALNIVLQNKVVFIDKKWNFFKGRDFPGNKPVIFHFSAQPKPWQLWYENRQNEYTHYKSLSLWAELPLQEPKYHREKRLYAKRKFKHGKIIAGLIWSIKYLFAKYLPKISAN